MEYNFRDIEKKWLAHWKKTNAYKVSNESGKPKYYVLDMFPYPSGAGLHVGHPLGYIASDIYARYKRLKGFNVLHPMGFDSFGLPAEQYALDTGQHPAETTRKNIATFKLQLDNIGFCYDWSREVQTSDPAYYKWTQWIFIQLFNSYFCTTEKKALPISLLIKKYQTKGAVPNNGQFIPGKHFTAEEWNGYSTQQQEEILMNRRLAFSKFGEVNWCEALGTVLANDEVVNGVSERGGYPVEKKKMRQWYLRITSYADRLLEGLEKVDFSDSMKEMQRNWIGKSEGAEVEFRLTPNPSPGGEGNVGVASQSAKFFQTADKKSWQILKDYGRINRKNATESEDILWQRIRNNQLGVKVRRQHSIGGYIVDFALLEVKLVIEVDGEYHTGEEQKIYDEARSEVLEELGLDLLRFTNAEVLEHTEEVIKKIEKAIDKQQQRLAKQNAVGDLSPLLRQEKGLGDEAKLKVYTTRPDTIFGVDFMVIAPEHELVAEITTPAQQEAIDNYLQYVKSRSDRERQAEVKQITGCFTGSYAINPFDGREIPVWIAEYVLAGYGTGAIMGVPCGDQRDFAFAKHFGIPVTNIIGDYFNGEEANPTKEAILQNSGFLNGLLMKDAIGVAIKAIEEAGIGQRKVNYKMRDAGFSRQRYWGEPFPIVWEDGVAHALNESELPLELPHVDSYKPGPEGEGPLANIKEWVLIPNPSPPAEKGAARVPKYSVHTPMQYEIAKELRKGHTDAEAELWRLLRDSQLGVKFRRQHPIDRYIVDFICLQEKIIVEVDGGYHQNEEQQKYDRERTRVLNEIGFDVMRFTNEEVMKDAFIVKGKIKEKLAEVATNSPLRLRRGAGGEGQAARETSTMPGYAGSSWYFLRYMDPHNDNEFCERKVSDYWNQVDLYIGGTEHAVGHLLYSRMWTKVLYDLNLIGYEEPYKRLVNQGMITGRSYFFAVYVDDNKDIDKAELHIRSYDKNSPPAILTRIRYGHQFVENDGKLLRKVFEQKIQEGLIEKPIHEIKWNNDGGQDFVFVKEESEKMSKSKYNVDNPDDLVLKYGADTFRMYEMFLGPVEMSKPWDTKGIEGVHRFLKKLWRLFFDEVKGKVWNEEKATDAELKVLHKTIKQIEEVTERFSFNTGVSGFMIAVNELTDLKCHKREILEPLLILLTPYAPHIAEELWQQLGNEGSILDAPYPSYDAKFLIESSKEYPISINGKLRTTMDIALDASQPEVEKIVLANEIVQKWLEGKSPKKIIFVKGKMVNVVI